MFQLHHIFVCTGEGAPAAQALRDAGLVEGSPNTHPGQGTANRRYFFEQGYLELLWVYDPEESRSELAGPTRLWERWAGRDSATHPFGLCFSSEQSLDSALPFASWTYRPDYLPQDRCFHFADGMPLSEPEVFALGWPQDQGSPPTEPTDHPLGLRKLESVSVGLPDPTQVSATLRSIADAGWIHIHPSSKPELVIGFAARQLVELAVPELGLRLIGRPDS